MYDKIVSAQRQSGMINYAWSNEVRAKLTVLGAGFETSVYEKCLHAWKFHVIKKLLMGTDFFFILTQQTQLKTRAEEEGLKPNFRTAEPECYGYVTCYAKTPDAGQVVGNSFFVRMSHIDWTGDTAEEIQANQEKDFTKWYNRQVELLKDMAD